MVTDLKDGLQEDLAFNGSAGMPETGVVTLLTAQPANGVYDHGDIFAMQ
jgi:hypothetical protein